VGRDRHGESRLLGGGEQAADVRHGVVLLDAFADDLPRHPFRAEEVNLRVGHDEGRPLEVELHVRRRKRPLGRRSVLAACGLRSARYGARGREGGDGGRARFQEPPTVEAVIPVMVVVVAHVDSSPFVLKSGVNPPVSVSDRRAFLADVSKAVIRANPDAGLKWKNTKCDREIPAR
jgi:hypothetical protein